MICENICVNGMFSDQNDTAAGIWYMGLLPATNRRSNWQLYLLDLELLDETYIYRVLSAFYLVPESTEAVYAGIWGYCPLLTAGAIGGYFAILTPRSSPLGRLS